MRYSFGDCELDLPTRELRRAGKRVPLQPRVFHVLQYLLEHPDRLVTKQELLAALWRSEHVNRTAVPWAIVRARKAIGQSGHRTPIQTVHGYGYRFVAEVRAHGLPAAGSGPQQLDGGEQARSGSAPPDAADAFIGHVGESEVLRRVLSEAAAGKGQLWVLSGDAGVGKSFAAADLAGHAKRLGFSTLVGRCVEGETAPAFWPFIQLLRALRRRPDPLPAALADELGHILSQLTALPGDPDSAERRRPPARVVARLVQALVALARSTPLFLLVEDAHWADVCSLQVLALLGSEIGELPVFVVLTLRQTREQAASSAPAELRAVLRCAQLLALEPWPAEVVAAYLASRAGESFVAFARDLHAFSGGNPLLVAQAVRLLVARVPGPGGAAQSAPDLARLLRELWHVRFQLLDESTRRVLEIASVIGTSFPLHWVKALSGLPSAELLRELDRAVSWGLLRPAATSTHAEFVHDVIRQGLYEQTHLSQRTQHHVELVRLLERGSEGGAEPSLLAYHAYRGQPVMSPAEVFGHARRAGDVAMHRFDYAHAGTFYGWALDMRAQGVAIPARPEAELILARATALLWAGNTSAAHLALETAIDLARRHRFADILIRAARRLSPGTLIAASVKPFARAALESALEMLGEEDSPLRVRALSQLAKLPLHSPDLSRSKALARQALAAAERLDRPREIVIALHAQLIALSGPDDVDALLAAVARIQELEGDRRSFYLAEAQMGRYRAHLLRGEIGAADRALDEYAAIAGELGIPELMSVLARRPALKALHAGKFELARDGFARALARDTELGAGQISKQHVLEIASVAREREDLSWLDPGGGSAVREVLVETACLLANRAAVLAWRGRSEEARMLFEQLAAGDFAGVPRDSSYLNTLANLSEAAIALDERASARRLYVLLAPYASYNTPNALGIYRGSAAYFLAILADYLGDDSAADAHYAQALVANEALAYVPGVARTCFAYAGLLARRGPAQQPGRARELAQRALELGREIGMLELTRRSEQLLTA